MDLKIFAFIFIFGIFMCAAAPLSGNGKNYISCSAIGHCIYEHATCATKIIRRDAGCIFRRKCCVTDFFDKMKFNEE